MQPSTCPSDSRRDAASRPCRWVAIGAVMGLGALLLWAGPTARTAEPPDSAFDAANRLFEQGRFDEAAAGFEAIAQSGQASAALYYNLGNAWFKAGAVGRAIVSYRQAARLAPRDPDVAANLAFARQAVPGATPPRESTVARWVGRLTVNEWAGLAGIALWLWMAALVWRQRVEETGPVLRRLCWIGAVSTALLAGALACAWIQLHGQRWVVVTVNDTVLRHGPLEESPSLQTLHDGQELRVLDEKDAWLLVSGAARGQGWLKRDKVVAAP